MFSHSLEMTALNLSSGYQESDKLYLPAKEQCQYRVAQSIAAMQNVPVSKWAGGAHRNSDLSNEIIDD